MPTEEEKKAAQRERDSIQVTVVSKSSEGQQQEKTEDNEPEPEVKEPEGSEPEVKEEIENKEDKVAEGEKEVEKLEEQLEDKTLTAKQREKLENRIEKQRKENKDLKTRIEALERQLAAKPNDERVLTEDDVERRASELADQKAQQKEFEDTVNRVAKGCQKLDKDFQVKIAALLEDAGQKGFSPIFINVLDDLRDNGSDVLMYLTKNADEYEEIKDLKPTRMALRLKEISDKIKPKAKQISKVPDPIEPVGGKGRTPESKASMNDDMDTFVKKRAIEAEAHRRKKLGLPPLN